MPLDPDVLAALQAAHDAEATASEKWHKQEHQFKEGEGKYPKLKKWFHRRHREAYCRQHDLRCWMIKQGGTVDTNLGDTSYSNDPEKAFSDACDTLDGLSDRYRDLLKAAKDAGDAETREKFHGYLKHLQSTYKKGEQKQQLLADLGPVLFKLKHS